MLIAELRGTIITIRAEALTDTYFDELQRSKKNQKKSLSEILVDQDIGVGYKDFNSAYEYKGSSRIQHCSLQRAETPAASRGYHSEQKFTNAAESVHPRLGINPYCTRNPDSELRVS